MIFGRGANYDKFTIQQRGREFILFSFLKKISVVHLLHLFVESKGIKINDNRELIEGVVNTSWDAAYGTDLFSIDLNGYEEKVKSMTESTVGPIINKLNQGGRILNKIVGTDPISFPLGLQDVNLVGVPSTLAIMGIAFTSVGTVCVCCSV